MPPRTLLRIDRLSEPDAERILAAVHALDAAWANLAAGQSLHIDHYLEGAHPHSHAATTPLPPPADSVHADARLALLALACDLADLTARFPTEPADWRLSWARDRRPRLTFTKPATPANSNHNNIDT